LDCLPFYVDAATKVNWFHQRPCNVCGLGDEFPTQMFPIGLPPWSHQCSSDVGPALRRAIDASPFYSEHFRRHTARGGVCMRLVFVLGDGAAMKDCDNMAKGVQDAFEGYLYADDRLVEHLDLMKIYGLPGTPGYILVRVASTTINNHDDV